MIPPLGQVVWTIGVLRTFANAPFCGIYAPDIVFTESAAVAFWLTDA